MPILDLRPGLRAFLLADASVSGLVVDRIYPLVLKQGERRDSIVYQTISATGDHNNQGPSGLASPRIQITSWSDDVDRSNALGRVVRDRLDGYAGIMGSGVNAITVRGVFFEDERDLYDDALTLYGTSQDYFIWFAER